jgi:hypothetical protein
MGPETDYTFPTTPPVLTQDENGIWEVEIARVIIDSTTYILQQQHISSSVGYIDLFDQCSPLKNALITSEYLISGYNHITDQVFGGWYAEAVTAATAAGIGTATRRKYLYHQCYSW